LLKEVHSQFDGTQRLPEILVLAFYMYIVLPNI